MTRLATIGWDTSAVFEHSSELTPSGANLTGFFAGDNTITRGSWSAYSLKILAAPSSAGVIPWVPGPIVTPAITDTWYVRFYMYVDTTPSQTTTFFCMNGTVTTTAPTVGIALQLTTSMTLQLVYNNVVKTPASATLNTAQWYRIEVRGISGASGQGEFKVDGTSVVSVSGATGETVAWAQVAFGSNSATTRTCNIYIDDLAINDSNGAAQNTWVGDSRVKLLIPTADSAVGTGWTDSGAASTGLWQSVDNIPPTGIADTTANAGHQIRNATSNANVNYDATLQSYSAAGIASGDTINVVQPLAFTGAPSGTSAKSGTFGVVSNPAGSQLTLSPNTTGANGTFYTGNTVAGTFETGWKPTYSTAVAGDIASGSRGTGPVVRLAQVTASTRIAMCCFMGLYVDYTPGSTTPVGEIVSVKQAIPAAAYR